jgi:hypothetical protein
VSSSAKGKPISSCVLTQSRAARRPA